MRGGTSRRRGGATTVSIPVQATSTGSVAANAFTGWTNLSGGAITNVTAFGTTAKYLHANNENAVFARTTGVSFDQEVTFWSARCVVYLRLTDAGAALALVLSTDGSWYTLYVPSVATGTFFDTGTGVLMGSGTPSGINMSDTDGDLWTFGCSGFEVYVKWNGVEQWRGKQIYHHVPGRVGLRTFATGTTFGFRSVSVEHKLSGALNSSPIESIIDVRDMGLKTLTATGSMSAASTTLTLTSNPGFAIGDPIIVVIGGESGAGERGTRGVGGQWPTLTYANATARNADTSQATNKVAGQLDNGLTYQWNGSAWVTYDYGTLGTGNINSRILPKSLITTITNVSGTTLTLADASTVATTGALVVYNNATRLEAEIGFNYTGAGIPTYVNNKTIYWPEGTWYVGQNQSYIAMMGGSVGWTLRGAGRDSTTIKAPLGVSVLKIREENKTNCTIERIEFFGNYRGDKGFVLWYDSNDVQLQGGFSDIASVTSTNFVIQECRFINTQVGQSGTNPVFEDIECQSEAGWLGYSGWQIALPNATGGRANNIVIDNPYPITAAEFFGGSDNQFTNVTITNGLFSCNSTSNWLVDNISITIEEDCAEDPTYDWVLDNLSILSINSNQSGDGVSSTTGTLQNFNITLNYSNSSNHLFRAISLSGNNDDITISGDFPAKPNTSGLITLPTGWSSSVAKGVYSGGDPELSNIDITGIRVTPPNSGSGGEVFLYSASSSITNSVVDVVDSDQTESGNITNAAYNAL